MKAENTNAGFLENSKALLVSLMFAASMNIISSFIAINAAQFVDGLSYRDNLLAIAGGVLLFALPLAAAYAGFIVFERKAVLNNRRMAFFIYLPVVYAVNFFFVPVFIGYYCLSLEAVKMLASQ
jgi:tryptophan-rich sensory protein